MRAGRAEWIDDAAGRGGYAVGMNTALGYGPGLQDPAVRYTELKTRLRADPFEPFRIVMESGEAFDVCRPGTGLLTTETYVLPVGYADDGIADEARLLGLAQIQDLRPLEGPVPAVPARVVEPESVRAAA